MKGLSFEYHLKYLLTDCIQNFRYLRYPRYLRYQASRYFQFYLYLPTCFQTLTETNNGKFAIEDVS